jgi:hypothetical protein
LPEFYILFHINTLSVLNYPDAKEKILYKTAKVLAMFKSRF